MSDDRAAQYVALVARQYQLKSTIQEKQDELKTVDLQTNTGNIELGQTIYEQHVLCSRQDKLNELHTFYRDTVLLQIINSQVQQYNRKLVWSWIDSNPVIWKDWDSLLEYVKRSDTQSRLLQSWETCGCMDVSGAGNPISVSGFDDAINLKRLSKDRWQDMIETLKDEMREVEVKLGESGRRFAKLLAADKSQTNLSRRKVITNVLASSEAELVTNENKLRSMKAVLGLPIDD